MILYENDCVDCGLHCFPGCRYLNSPHYYCDECGDETNELYEVDGKELCCHCFKLEE